MDIRDDPRRPTGPANLPARREARPDRPGYRPPRILPLGEAADLVRQSSTGQLRDGNGGWWVWGS